MSSPHHPIYPQLMKLGYVSLVGSRSFPDVLVDNKLQSLWNDGSDWDYYLGSEAIHMSVTTVALKNLEFKHLPGEAGPYGADQLIEGVFRLDARTVFGSTYPHVDVILGTRTEINRRVEVWSNILRLGGAGGRLARGLKSEKAWGAFWWATNKWEK